MKHIWTKVATIITSLFSGLLLGSAALAIDASNSNTGADSTNNATVTVQNNTTINSVNNAVINNNISVNANTGNNTANKNTGNGTISTGDITGSVIVKNLGNENGTFDSVLNLNCASNCNFSASNSNTGADSNNKSQVKIKNNLNVTITNNANVNNNIGANLNTGGNSTDKNTGSGSITTGDIDFSIEVINDLNRNIIGGPVPGEEPDGPGLIPQPGIIPSEAGQILAAAAGLPITGQGLPIWPMILVAIGFALKILDKALKVRFVEK